MIANTFKRYERKFILSQEQYRIVQTGFAEHMQLDGFCRKEGHYSVSTIYFDTPEFSVIRRCKEFPEYKEKLRLRSYGTPKSDGDTVFLCLKKKLHDEGNKRRAALTLAQAEEFLSSRRLPPDLDYLDRQVLDEIAYFMSDKDLAPAMYIGYNRIAYFGKEEQGLRITVDTDLVCRTADLDLKKGPYGTSLLAEGDCLMEVKIPGAIPAWLCRLLSRAEAYPRSFSKYGKAFETELLKPAIKIAV